MSFDLPTLYSLLPRSSTPTAPLPEVGTPAPPLGDIDLADSRPTLVAFVRHCGCPFAEKEIKLLGAACAANERLRVVVVQHSDAETTGEWFERIG